jgi:hypothetical protein
VLLVDQLYVRIVAKECGLVLASEERDQIREKHWRLFRNRVFTRMRLFVPLSADRHCVSKLNTASNRVIEPVSVIIGSIFEIFII